MWALYVVVSLVGVGCATGFANTVSLTSERTACLCSLQMF